MGDIYKKRRNLQRKIKNTFDPETKIVLEQKLYLVEKDISEIKRIGKYLLEKYVDKPT